MNSPNAAPTDPEEEAGATAVSAVRSASTAEAAVARGTLGRMARLALKELRETLRDRRTILTLVLMPLLVYPLLSLVFQKFLLTSLPASGKAEFLIAVESEETGKIVGQFLRTGEAIIHERRQRENRSPEEQRKARRGNRRTQAGNTVVKSSATTPPLPDSRFRIDVIRIKMTDDLESAVSDGTYDLGIRVRGKIKLANTTPVTQPVPFELLHLKGSSFSEKALEAAERCLDAVNDEHRAGELYRLRRVVLRPPRDEALSQHVPTLLHRKTLTGTSGSSPFSLAALIPLILILMTITGAVYPAIDLTAGERERGTLEMLVAAPVPRLGLLLAKYSAVLFVAMLTATVNLVGMTVTILATGLGSLLFGSEGLSPFVVIAVFGLMLLFAAFFSAVLLVLTSFARSFKEAQAYLIPLMLVSIAPGVLSMVPDLELGGVLLVTPLANIVLLARDLFQGAVTPVSAAVVVVSTLLYAAAALTLAARIFGTDAILYGSHGSWSDLFRRPLEPADKATVTGAMMCLAILFPATILLGQTAAHFVSREIEWQMAATSIITIALFGGIPALAAVYRRVNFLTGFSLRRPDFVSLAAALLLGVSLWPFVFELVMMTQKFGIVSINSEMKELTEKLLSGWRTISPIWVLLAYAAVPAVFEEFFFRGYLLSALRGRINEQQAILASAVLFGLFHVVITQFLAVERLLPSTLMGLVLGWVCVKTGSLLPGILLHACHNGLPLMAGYYQHELESYRIGIDEEMHLPWELLLPAAVLAAIGFALMVYATRRNREPTQLR